MPYGILNPDSFNGEVILYATVSGGGNGYSWGSPMTLRQAIAACDGTKLYTIYVSAGFHDLNNGSDGTGTTLSANNVRIKGAGNMPGVVGRISRLKNTHASASKILTVTGARVSLEGITFDNRGLTDPNVDLLTINTGGYVNVSDCLFIQETGDTSGKGIVIGGGLQVVDINNCHFRRIVNSAIEVGDATRVYGSNVHIWNCGTGIKMSHANADQTFWDDVHFYGCTTAVDVTTAQAKNHSFTEAYFSNCTANVADFSAWGGTVIFNAVHEPGNHQTVYPLQAAGVTVSKNANAYVWGSITQVIPTATINKPFRVRGVNIQAWSGAQNYTIELFYGNTAGDTSMGVYEALLPTPGGSGKVSVPVDLDSYVPARSYVGARIYTDTAATDDITFSLSYEAL